MIAALGKRLSQWSERWVPDPFVFALVLSLVTFLLGLGFGGALDGQPLSARLSALASGWFGSFYGTGLMKFALQMCIVLVTGHAIAKSNAARAGIDWVVGFAKTPAAAAAIVAFVACLASLVQWGLGAIAGAFLAREMGRSFARRGRKVHYPLLGAAGYAGFLVWHGGLSGSAPLKVAEPGHFLVKEIGVIPISQTLFSPLNIAVTLVMLVVITATFWALMPSEDDDMVGYEGPLDEEPNERRLREEGAQLASVDALMAEDSGASGGGRTAVAFLEDSAWLNRVAGVVLLAVAAWFFANKGVAGWNLDSINLLFLAIGLVLHPSPMSYARAVADGARGAAGIILQFPFYFGILGLLKSSGLIVQIADFFVSFSSANTFPLYTFLSAGLVNFFVPSGGGQWAVQGPVMMRAVESLGADPAKAVMALAYGDAWTNMMQPFWALPLLGIMGLRARDIIGYTTFVMLVTGPIFLILLAVF